MDIAASPSKWNSAGLNQLGPRTPRPLPPTALAFAVGDLDQDPLCKGDFRALFKVEMPWSPAAAREELAARSDGVL